MESFLKTANEFLRQRVSGAITG